MCCGCHQGIVNLFQFDLNIDSEYIAKYITALYCLFCCRKTVPMVRSPVVNSSISTKHCFRTEKPVNSTSTYSAHLTRMAAEK